MMTAWTDRSVNPIRARLHGHIGHHCEKVSAGCANCYSSRIQSRFTMPEFRADRRQGVEVFFDDARLREVLTRRTPTMWFWCDMTDLFGDWVEEAWIDKVFAVCALTPQHTHQILTKRPERMRAYMEARAHRAMFWKDAARSLGYALEWEGISLVPFPLPNVWLGVSVEDQATADQRIPLLLQTPAAVRWVSYEPALDRVRFHAIRWETEGSGGPAYVDVLNGTFCTIGGSGLKGPRLDWVVVGGESGPKARTCDVAWIRAVVDQCRSASVPVFVKQLGANCGYAPDYGEWFQGYASKSAEEVGYRGVRRLVDRKGGNPDEWPADLRVRQFPAVRS